MRDARYIGNFSAASSRVVIRAPARAGERSSVLGMKILVAHQVRGDSCHCVRPGWDGRQIDFTIVTSTDKMARLAEHNCICKWINNANKRYAKEQKDKSHPFLWCFLFCELDVRPKEQCKRLPAMLQINNK